MHLKNVERVHPQTFINETAGKLKVVIQFSDVNLESPVQARAPNSRQIRFFRARTEAGRLRSGSVEAITKE